MFKTSTLKSQSVKRLFKSYYTIAAIIALTVLALLPLWPSQFMVASMILIFVYLACSEMWGFMAQHAGIISLCQQIFIGLGGYGLAIFSMLWGWPIWISVILVAIVGSIVAAALTVPLLRLRGIYLAIGSWVVAEIFLVFFNGWEYVGAGMGLVFRPAYSLSPIAICYCALAVGVSSIFLVYYFYHSKLGFGLRAIGCDEVASSEVGVNTFKCKAYCFIVAAFITTLAGSISLLNYAYLRATSAFDIDWTVNFIFISVIGGIGSIAGPIIGSIIFVAFEYSLSGYIGLSLFLQGVISIIILMFMPKGIWGSIAEKLHVKPPI
jgi:branched-chain amino acid transport system permease protein